MSLRIQISLLFLAGGLLLSDVAHASVSVASGGNGGTFSSVAGPHDRTPT